MSQAIEQLYDSVGKAAIDHAEALSGKLLVYAEVESGVISADIFYVNTTGTVRFRFCPKPMKDLIFALWEQWKALPGHQEWRVMCYIVDNGKFAIDLVYPDQIKDDEDLSDRRPRAIKRYFGDMKVDYANPS
jgi:hypothetical protein